MRLVVAVSLILSAGQQAARAENPSAEDVKLFETQVRPLLAEACFKCHGEKMQESGLRLDSKATMMHGGDRGPAVVPGSPEASLLIQAVLQQGELKMPQKSRLKPEEIASLSTWIQHGAPWPGEAAKVATRSGGPSAEERRFWSFQPIASPPVPKPRDAAWPKNEVDRFILAMQEAAGLTAVKTADKRTLIRRATFDLTGLPPTPEQVANFVADDSPGAFAKVVDGLLDSPAYGQRWGRYWLDVVRYADTAGETADFPVREAYKYRDYVIDAFNRDKPYDEFLREQIAGDILAADGPPDRFAERVTATGFIAISRRFGFDPENYQHLTIQDTIDTLGQSMLGLTLGCARCHDHKFDPVSTRDYYALYGIFASTNYAFPGSEQKNRPRDFVPLIPPSEAAARQKAFDEPLSKLGESLKQLDAERTTAEKELKSATDEKQADRIAALKSKLAELPGRRGEIDARQKSLVEAGPYPRAYGVSEGVGKNAQIQKRGEPTKLGDEVPRRFIEILGGFALPANSVGSGRLQLAQWVADKKNPVTARVMVNRIWQHHFGAGLVATENNFGARGSPPTHPELLDYLASRFVESGWSIKAMHRLIMLSQTYHLSSDNDATDSQRDPTNEKLWRFNRQRLDAESIRDAMLVLGGNLDRTPGGAHPFPPLESWNFTQHNPFGAVYDSNRRSIYLMTSRLQRHPYLALFDGADPNASTPHRTATTVPTQSLYLMNAPFVHAQSESLAAQLLQQRTDEPARVELAYRTIFARPPTAVEVAQSLEFLASYRKQLEVAGAPENRRSILSLAALARAMLISNEFLFVD